MSPARNRKEFIGLLNEQLDFLRTSTQAFDAGVGHEPVGDERIALDEEGRVLSPSADDGSTARG